MRESGDGTGGALHATAAPARVPPARAPSSPTPPRWDVDYDGLARDLRPLGNPTRVRLLNHLTTPKYLEEIASILRVNRSAAKKHVDELVRAGLVARAPGERETGAVIEYRIVPEKVFELFDGMRVLGTLRPAAGAGDAGRTKAAAAPEAGLPPPDRRPRLVVAYGIEPGAIIPIEDRTRNGPCVLGRDVSCQVRLPSDPYMSGRHAQVERRGSGHVITDLFSTNGTYLDRARLAPGEPVPIENGQLIGIGKSLLLYRDR